MSVRARTLLMLSAVLSVSGCAISRQQEVQLGNDYAQQINAQLPLVSDAATNRYITALGQQIVAATGVRDLTWSFTIVNSKEVNAFAVPGGHVYINRGLIERATNMSQVAGVLAHEIAHVTERHSVDQMQKAQGANVGVALLCTLTRTCQSGVGQAAINVGGGAVFARFSRSAETEADAVGVRLAVQAGIDPNGFPQMFRILLDERQRNPNAVEAFFSTHPLAEDRIGATQALIASYRAAELRGLQRDSNAFQTFKRRLAGLPAAPAKR
ncbi:MAG: M48 family metalloprotease [Gemmatimonadales bacterium]|nr:M48 family metalloprotease [Gemmatimonadales bacterium]